jgi:hypothetical protein
MYFRIKNTRFQGLTPFINLKPQNEACKIESNEVVEWREQ